jgi:HPt (histidine-containing phosphotransfer) domain-containing protein
VVARSPRSGSNRPERVLSRQLRNDPVKIAKFALKFIRTSREALAKIQAARDTGDLELLAGLCHEQKSAAASAGAQRTAALYETLEGVSKAGDRQPARALLEQLPSLLDHIDV